MLTPFLCIFSDEFYTAMTYTIPYFLVPDWDHITPHFTFLTLYLEDS